MFAETKAQTTAIDLELRRLEAKEASTHVQYLSAFMPEGFMKRGGNNQFIKSSFNRKIFRPTISFLYLL